MWDFYSHVIEINAKQSMSERLLPRALDVHLRTREFCVVCDVKFVPGYSRPLTLESLPRGPMEGEWKEDETERERETKRGGRRPTRNERRQEGTDEAVRPAAPSVAHPPCRLADEEEQGGGNW